MAVYSLRQKATHNLAGGGYVRASVSVEFSANSGLGAPRALRGDGSSFAAHSAASGIGLSFCQLRPPLLQGLCPHDPLARPSRTRATAVSGTLDYVSSEDLRRSSCAELRLLAWSVPSRRLLTDCRAWPRRPPRRSAPRSSCPTSAAGLEAFPRHGWPRFRSVARPLTGKA